MSQEKKNSAKELLGFIKAKKTVFLTFMSFSGKCYKITLYENMPAKEKQKCLRYLEDRICWFLMFGDSLVVRVCEHGSKNRVCGFFSKNGTFWSLDKESMKMCYELQPDGCRIEYDDTEYYQPELQSCEVISLLEA